jgi:membrane protein required for colicin V production
MTAIDIALILLLLVCAARGFWRGLIREFFGFTALVAGVTAALLFTEAGAAAVGRSVDLPLPTRTAIAFLGVFMLVHVTITLAGLMLGRVFGASTLSGVGRLAGAAFGVGKAALVLAFVFLFLELFPVLPRIDSQMRDSRFVRPLASVAGNILRAGLRDGRQA